jgi:DNA-binding NtrC family response regulator
MKATVDEFENHLIQSALQRFNWNKNRAAKFLSMNRTTLVEKIKKKGIHQPQG